MAMILNNLRGAGRLVALLAVILGAGVAYGVRRSHRRDATSKALWLQQTCRRALRVLAVRVESTGTPARGAMIAANHLSYLDILVLASLTPAVFVSKKEVRGWPVFGWFAEKAGTRFIDRTRRGDVARIGAEMKPVIEANLTLVVFLEGTTSDGRGVLAFKASLLEPAVQNRWNVVPVGISYRVPTPRSVELEVCWWGEMTLAPHLWNFTTIPWVRAHVGWGSSLVTEGERKEFAELIRGRVLDLRVAANSQ